MSSYRLGFDFDVPLASLTVLVPQPRSTGVQPTRRTFTGNSVILEGLYTEWLWDGGIDNALHYQQMLVTLGLTGVLWREVTIYTRDDRFEWIRYNGVAIRPEPIWQDYFPRMNLLIRDLQEIG